MWVVVRRALRASEFRYLVLEAGRLLLNRFAARVDACLGDNTLEEVRPVARTALHLCVHRPCRRRRPGP